MMIFRNVARATVAVLAVLAVLAEPVRAQEPVAAAITDTQITSTPLAASDTYGLDEVIEFAVTYDTAVDVTGSPQFPVNFGQSPSGGPEYAAYAGGTGTTEITFEWVVAATDQDTNGLFLYGPTDSQGRGEINGGTIFNAGTSVEADRATLHRGTKSGHKVDGSLSAGGAPSFVDDTGDAQNWTIGTTISNITVPLATGDPTPTYAAVGDLPAGISFNTISAVIFGTPTAVGSGTITIRATNTAGTDDWTVAYTTAGLPEVPSFTDDTGDTQSWTQDAAIASVTVPEADGTPAPTYAVVGTLPAGLSFDAGTRVISGTPTAVGSGTITIRATNTEGTDDWTVAYTTAAAPVAPSFTDDTGDAQSWTEDAAIASISVPEATGNPAPTYAVVGTLPGGLSFNPATRVISGTPTAVGSGTITIRATNTAGTDDWTVAYTTEGAPAAPSFTDDTGDAQRWTVGTSITSITVPEATGNPAPTYAVVGTLPGGLSFDTAARVMFGAPTAAGSGTIRVRATNTEGTDDWTVAYTTAAATAAPSFTDDTGDAQSWTEDAAIASISVPEATGNPAPTYAVVGTLPGGLSFNPATRVISGTPTAVGSGTITIRATNTAGTDDWTVAYTTAAAPVAPSFTDDTGDAQSWTQDAAIAAITVPDAGGTPAPTYAVVGTLPGGLGFDAGTRVISGTPTAVGSGTIRIRATNTEGTDDWTVAYTTAAATVAPSFTDDTGDAQSWTVGTSITSITVSEAAGNPAPTYAVVGALPAGLSFDPATRVISGTPTAADSGTIRIRATNTVGTDDWTVAYTTAAAPAAPSFTDDTGDAQSWMQNAVITAITVPEATGNPAPTYAVVGTLPAGLSFDTAARVMFGAPTAAGSGTITIRATNTEGTDDWTVAYTTASGQEPDNRQMSLEFPLTTTTQPPPASPLRPTGYMSRMRLTMRCTSTTSPA